MISAQLPVSSIDAKPFSNEYRVAFSHKKFVQTVRFNPNTCVYQRWAGTAYRFGLAAKGS